MTSGECLNRRDLFILIVFVRPPFSLSLAHLPVQHFCLAIYYRCRPAILPSVYFRPACNILPRPHYHHFSVVVSSSTSFFPSLLPFGQPGTEYIADSNRLEKCTAKSNREKSGPLPLDIIGISLSQFALPILSGS